MANYKIFVDQIGSGDTSTAVSDSSPLPTNISTLSTTVAAQISGGWNRTAVNSTGTTVIRTVAANGVVIFGGYQVVSAAGAFTLDLYDSAAAASGNKLCQQANVNVLADYTQNINCANGIVASMSGDPTDNCIFILWK